MIGKIYNLKKPNFHSVYCDNDVTAATFLHFTRPEQEREIESCVCGDSVQLMFPSHPIEVPVFYRFLYMFLCRQLLPLKTLWETYIHTFFNKIENIVWSWEEMNFFLIFSQCVLCCLGDHVTIFDWQDVLHTAVKCTSNPKIWSGSSSSLSLWSFSSWSLFWFIKPTALKYVH